MWRIFYRKFLKEKFQNLKCTSNYNDGDLVKNSI